MQRGKVGATADSEGCLSVPCHTCFPPSRCSRQGHTLLLLEQIGPAVFFWCLFIASRIPRAAGGRLPKTTQARSCTSKRPSLFFTRLLQEPPLFSPGNQILLEIFLSDITIYRALALDIMFISDLYMSTWPIKFTRG